MNLQGSTLETTGYDCISEVPWVKHAQHSHTGLGWSEYIQNKVIFTVQRETDPQLLQHLVLAVLSYSASTT